MLVNHYFTGFKSIRMSDPDDSFYDSFDSESDSDRADGPGPREENFLHMMTNQKAPAAFQSSGGASLEIPAARKDLLLLAGNGERGGQSDLSDQDDWR